MTDNIDVLSTVRVDSTHLKYRGMVKEIRNGFAVVHVTHAFRRIRGRWYRVTTMFKEITIPMYRVRKVKK